MINSKAKGAAGERAFCHLCRDNGFSNVHRTAQFCGKTGQAGDVEGLKGIHVEVKFTKHLNLQDAMDQSVRDSEAEQKGNIPIVAHKKDYCGWLVTMRATDWFELYREWINSLK